MRKIKEMLRLKYENGLSINKASVVCNIGRTTGQEYLRRFEVSGLAWPLPPTSDITREILTQKLRNSLKNKEAQKGKTQNPNVVPS